MTWRAYRFSPPWWGVLLFVTVAGVLCALGLWQIERAHEKQALLAARQAARQAGPTRLRPELAARAIEQPRADLDHGRRYWAEGRYDAAHQILLNDQVRARQTGYRVWTPLVLDNGIRVMVDRGWVPKASGDQPRPNPPAPRRRVRVHGLWHGFPAPGLRSAEANSCASRPWPRALNFPSAATVRCQYRAGVVDGLLLLDPREPYGFVRDWQRHRARISPVRHIIYACQWFLMALVVAVIFGVVNTNRR